MKQYLVQTGYTTEIPVKADSFTLDNNYVARFRGKDGELLHAFTGVTKVTKPPSKPPTKAQSALVAWYLLRSLVTRG